LENDGASVSRLDLTENTEAAWKEALLPPSQQSNHLDVIVNVSIPDNGGAIGEVTPQQFREIIEASYIRNWLALKYGIQRLRASDGGVFISITSVDGKRGAPAAVGRCAASHGITLMTKSAALECADRKDNVRVNAILAGDILPGEHETLTAGHVSPDDLAFAVAHLASDASVYITGLIMPVENGTQL